MHVIIAVEFSDKTANHHIPVKDIFLSSNNIEIKIAFAGEMLFPGDLQIEKL
jgi:hypothetical protein